MTRGRLWSALWAPLLERERIAWDPKSTITPLPADMLYERITELTNNAIRRQTNVLDRHVQYVRANQDRLKGR